MEWGLTGESWMDWHVHDEYAYVLKGISLSNAME